MKPRCSLDNTHARRRFSSESAAVSGGNDSARPRNSRRSATQPRGLAADKQRGARLPNRAMKFARSAREMGRSPRGFGKPNVEVHQLANSQRGRVCFPVPVYLYTRTRLLQGTRPGLTAQKAEIPLRVVVGRGGLDFGPSASPHYGLRSGGSRFR